MVSVAPAAVLGFIVGLRHAIDADHVAAVGTIVARERNLRGAALIGAAWGLGHTLSLLVLGGAIVAFDFVVPRRVGLMLELGVGSIINTSSVWGIYAAPANAAYHCSKGAAHQMTKNAAVTYAPHNIRVNSLLPGYVDTPMSRGVTPEEAETLIQFTPMGRRAEAEEVSGMVVYLASDEASFTVGGTFTVDGGMAAL